MELEEAVAALMQRRDSQWAQDNFLPTVWSLIERVDNPSVVEIGGGRSPAFSEEKIKNLGVDYTSNDISQRELSLAPDWVRKANFDVQTPDRNDVAPYAGQFDLAFSRMVMEHVSDYRRAYANIHEMLRHGGVAIAIHPVLFSVPFVANKLLPQNASEWILRKIDPRRTDEEIPKFPASYSGCRISSSVREQLKMIGFRRVWHVPFYGHAYYNTIPMMSRIHGRFSDRLAAYGLSAMASYAYTIAEK